MSVVYTGELPSNFIHDTKTDRCSLLVDHAAQSRTINVAALDTETDQ